MSDDNYNWRVSCYHCKIKEIDWGNRWRAWVEWVIVGRLGWSFLIVMFCVDVEWYIHYCKKGLHPVSSHSCRMSVRAGRSAFARPYEGVYRSTSLMSFSLLLQQCPAYMVRLTWIVFVMGGRWPYCWCLVGCCCQDLFNIARSQQLCEDTGCSPEDQPEAMNDREKWRERVSGTTWWWWWM